MTIGAAARACGLSPSAIRFYEAEGILPKPARTASGYRVYQGGDVDLLRFAARMREIGLGLGSIRSAVGLRRGSVTREEVHRLIAEIDRKLDDVELVGTYLRGVRNMVSDSAPSIVSTRRAT